MELRLRRNARRQCVGAEHALQRRQGNLVDGFVWAGLGVSVLLMLCGTVSAVGAQEQLGELKYEEVSGPHPIVDNPDLAILLVESTVLPLQFFSRGGIRGVRESEPGIYEVLLRPGVHIMEIRAEGFLLLRLPRWSFAPQSGRRIRVTRATAPEGEGLLIVESTPPGASITLNDVRLAELTPVRLPRQPAGGYQIGLFGVTGYGAVDTAVVVRVGDTTRVAINLQRAVAEVRLPDDPVAAVFVPEVLARYNLRFVEGGMLPDIGRGVLDVSSFYIGIYPVTWGEWQEVRGWALANGYDLEDAGRGCAADHPVHLVNWYDVVKWCNALSEKENRQPVYKVEGVVYRTGERDDVQLDTLANGFRLLVEAEWEYAARGGSRSQGYVYSGSNDVDAVAWYSGNAVGAPCDLHAGRGTWPVGQKASNELGLYDMSGNVSEWCFDRCSSPVVTRRIRRGGSWHFNEAYSRLDQRLSYFPGNRYFDGFRLAASTSP